MPKVTFLPIRSTSIGTDLDLLLGVGVVDVHDLVLGGLLGQRFVGGHEAEVLDEHEAGQGHLLGVVLLVAEEVLVVPVGDPEGLPVLTFSVSRITEILWAFELADLPA